MATPQVPALLHKMSVSSQKAWYKKNNMELPAHLKPVSAAQAKKADKPTGTKELERKSLQAYGATKGTKVGEVGGEKPAADRDTVKPLSPEQHAKVQAAIKAAKGTVTKKRAPIKSKADRLAFIKAAVAKAKSPKRAERFDVPTLDNNDDHAGVRRDNDLMHLVRYRPSYNEEVELEESMTDSWKNVQSMPKGSVTGGKEEIKQRHAYLTAVYNHHKKYGNDTSKVRKEIESLNRSRVANEEVEQIDERKKVTHEDPLVTVHDEHGLHTHANLSTANRIFGTSVKHTNVHAGPVKTSSESGKDLTFALSKHHEKEVVKEETKTSAGGQEMSLAQKLAQQAMKLKKQTPGADDVKHPIAQQMGEEVEQVDESILRFFPSREENQAVAKRNSEIMKQKEAQNRIARKAEKLRQTLRDTRAKMRDPDKSELAQKRIASKAERLSQQLRDTKAHPHYVALMQWRARNEEVEQINEGPSHFRYTGTVNGKDYEVHIPSNKDLGDYSDSALHRKLSNENPHLAHHEITAIVHSGGVEKSREEVIHDGKKHTHVVVNHQEPAHIYEETVKDGDDKEYDYEGEMAKTQLKGILKHAQNLHDSLEDDTNLPEWVQSKITLAHDYIQTASDYMDAQDDEDLDEEVQNIDEKYMGFKALKSSIAAKGGARDPGAVAAAIGRKKYGKAAFQKAAAKGEKMEEALDPVGKEDKDVNNDGKVDGTDKYLLNRRAAVAKAIKSKMAKKLGK